MTELQQQLLRERYQESDDLFPSFGWRIAVLIAVVFSVAFVLTGCLSVEVLP